MMAKESAADLAGGGPLAALGAAAQRSVSGRSPPLHLWNPPFCGDIDIRIACDGTWFYSGTPIGRPALVRLFASILRREPEGVMLVTPVEKVRIVVDDAPFLAVAMTLEEDSRGRVLVFRTNVDDVVRADATHPLRFRPGAAEGTKPYVTVRDGLEALVRRSLFFDLVEHGEIRGSGDSAMFGVASAGVFFPMAPAATIQGLM